MSRRALPPIPISDVSEFPMSFQKWLVDFNKFLQDQYKTERSIQHQITGNTTDTTYTILSSSDTAELPTPFLVQINYAVDILVGSFGGNIELTTNYVYGGAQTLVDSIPPAGGTGPGTLLSTTALTGQLRTYVLSRTLVIPAYPNNAISVNIDTTAVGGSGLILNLTAHAKVLTT